MALATESLGAIRVVFSFGAEEREVTRYGKAVDSGVAQTRKRGLICAIGIGCAMTIMFLVQALALYYGCLMCWIFFFFLWNEKL